MTPGPAGSLVQKCNIDTQNFRETRKVVSRQLLLDSETSFSSLERHKTCLRDNFLVSETSFLAPETNTCLRDNLFFCLRDTCIVSFTETRTCLCEHVHSNRDKCSSPYRNKFCLCKILSYQGKALAQDLDHPYRPAPMFIIWIIFQVGFHAVSSASVSKQAYCNQVSQ